MSEHADEFGSTSSRDQLPHDWTRSRHLVAVDLHGIRQIAGPSPTGGEGLQIDVGDKLVLLPGYEPLELMKERGPDHGRGRGDSAMTLLDHFLGGDDARQTAVVPGYTQTPVTVAHLGGMEGHVALRVLFQHVDLALQLVGIRPGIVALADGGIAAATQSQGVGERRYPLRQLVLAMEIAANQPGIAALKVANDIGGAIARRIVVDDDLEGEAGLLGQHALERPGDKIVVIVGGAFDTDHGQTALP